MSSTPIVIENFIDGSFAPCSNTLQSVNPSTGAVNALVPDSGEEEVEAAVRAAGRAFPKWKAMSCQSRGNFLLKLADLLESHLKEFAEAESEDQGKPVWLALRMDIPRAVHNLRHFATTTPHLMGTSKILPEDGVINYTTREAIGVAGLISPWNLPLYLLTFKLAPALMAGNTVVAKPSELTSVTAFMLCKLIREAEFPAGVVNMVFGVGAKVGAALTTHPKVPVMSFTGSTVTGGIIASAAAPLFKKLSLEMGGKNAALVYADCDLVETLKTLTRASFINQGEVCLCTSRIFVQKDIYEKFLEQFLAKTRDLKVGDPRDPDVFVGALNSGAHLEKVRRCVAEAVEEGAVVQCGYTKEDLILSPENQHGFFMAPTVLTGVRDNFRCMQEEIFGPVTCVLPFETEAEVIKRANDVRYGLCAAVFTQDLGRAHRTAQGLEVGTVWTNCWLVRDLDLPFGGVKKSGQGREGTHDSWDFYTEQKTVCIKL